MPTDDAKVRVNMSSGTNMNVGVKWSIDDTDYEAFGFFTVGSAGFWARHEYLEERTWIVEIFVNNSVNNASCVKTFTTAFSANYLVMNFTMPEWPYGIEGEESATIPWQIDTRMCNDVPCPAPDAAFVDVLITVDGETWTSILEDMDETGMYETTRRMIQ